MYLAEKCYYIFIFQYDKLFSPATENKTMTIFMANI